MREGENLQAQILEKLQRTNELLERQIHTQQNWRIPLRNGLLAGLGSVVGATVVVSILVAALRPLSGVQELKPTLDRIATALEQKK